MSGAGVRYRQKTNREICTRREDRIQISKRQLNPHGLTLFSM
jgi:hypothetical protein